jgi:hypothetical protein
MPETSLLDESIAKLEALKKKRTSLKQKLREFKTLLLTFNQMITM